MKMLKQFDALVLDSFEEAVYSTPVHTHTYYEIIYIHKGHGTHYLNNNAMPYKAGDLYLLSPGDSHIFDIRKSTHFSFIKFTENYLNDPRFSLSGCTRTKDPLAIMRLNEVKETTLELAEPYRTILRKTVENILTYSEYKNLGNSPIIHDYILAILDIVAEILPQLKQQEGGRQPDKHAVTTYIHQHIYHKQELRIPAIAAHFNIAATYFSNYFKRHFDMGYREYIEQYRLKLIETRLLTGNRTLKQIAAEFDYTDESHFIKSFRKQTGVTPSEFVKQAAV